MLAANWRDPELERMLENSRDAVRRSQELIKQTGKLLEQSKMLLDGECTNWPSWPPGFIDPTAP